MKQQMITRGVFDIEISGEELATMIDAGCDVHWTPNEAYVYIDDHARFADDWVVATPHAILDANGFDSADGLDVLLTMRIDVGRRRQFYAIHRPYGLTALNRNGNRANEVHRFPLRAQAIAWVAEEPERRELISAANKAVRKAKHYARLGLDWPQHVMD